jgi:hypothetical protein
MGFESVLDSYYKHVKDQMAIVRPDTRFGGYVQARDWPLAEIQFDTLYLLVLSANPSRGSSVAQIKYRFVCQWTWLVAGDDISASQQAANRGNRFRTSMALITALRQANYPGYCQKKSYAASSEGVITATAVGSTYPYSSVETVNWTPLRFPMVQNEQAGIVYGVGAVDVFGFDDVLDAIA